MPGELPVDVTGALKDNEGHEESRLHREDEPDTK